MIIRYFESRTAASSKSTAVLTKLFESSAIDESIEKIIQTFGRFIDCVNKYEKLEYRQMKIKLCNEEKKQTLKFH